MPYNVWAQLAPDRTKPTLEKRRAQKAERLVRGEALSRTYLEVLDQEFQLRETDRPFKISTWQLRGEPSTPAAHGLEELFSAVLERFLEPILALHVYCKN
jgi:hypothetical protein